jgi:UDP-N-acetylmuramate dehydrogenase
VSLLLSDCTTLRVGGAASRVAVAASESELMAAVREADHAGEAVLVLGGGSNMVCADAGFDGTVVRIATQGVTRIDDREGVAMVSVQAGEPWDDFVAWTLAEGLSGVEALSGIPGLVGATPMQNVGAYGQEVADVVATVVALDRATGQVEHLTAAECQFRYRMSRFKAEPERWVILAVTFALPVGSESVVRYAELASHLGVAVGDAVPAEDVRTGVLELRRTKGMVLDPADHDTWSVGSFFTNPIVSAEVADAFASECPRYPADSGVKLSAAWLIESSGIGRGWGVREDARARVSTKHVLALTNRGGATAADVLELAYAIRDRVKATHGIPLQIEPQLVGF